MFKNMTVGEAGSGILLVILIIIAVLMYGMSQNWGANTKPLETFETDITLPAGAYAHGPIQEKNADCSQVQGSGVSELSINFPYGHVFFIKTEDDGIATVSEKVVEGSDLYSLAKQTNSGLVLANGLGWVMPVQDVRYEQISNIVVAMCGGKLFTGGEELVK